MKNVIPLTKEESPPEMKLPGNIKVVLPEYGERDQVTLTFDVHFTDENKMAALRASVCVAVAAIVFCALLTTAMLAQQ